MEGITVVYKLKEFPKVMKFRRESKKPQFSQ